MSPKPGDIVVVDPSEIDGVVVETFMLGEASNIDPETGASDHSRFISLSGTRIANGERFEAIEYFFDDPGMVQVIVAMFNAVSPEMRSLVRADLRRRGLI